MTILITLIGIAASVAIIGYLFRRRRYSYWKNLGLIQDVPTFFFGKKTEYSKEYTMELYFKYKNCGAPLIGYYFYHQPATLVLDLDLVKTIFIKDFQYFTDRGFGHNRTKDSPLGNNILFLDGVPWKTLRQKLTPSVTTNKIKAIMPDILKVGQELCDVITRKIETEPELDFKKLITCFTTDVVGKCVLGIDYNTLNDSRAEVADVLESYMKGFVREPFLRKTSQFPYCSLQWKLNLTPKSVSDYFVNVLQQILRKQKEENIGRKNFFSFLLELGSLTESELAASTFSYFIGGYHNNATALTSSLYQLAMNPLVQSKLRKEILTATEKFDGQITYESFQEMPYLEMVINGEITCSFRLLEVISFSFHRGNENPADYPTHFKDFC